MPSSDHTTASRISAMAPRNLRVRMVMAEMCNSFDLAQLARGEGPDYKGRTEPNKRASCKSFPSRNSPQNTAVRCVADRRRRTDRADGAGRRRDAADGVRAVDRRVEAGDRHAAAADGCAMARGLRGLQEDPAISRAQCRHDAGASSRPSSGGNGAIACSGASSASPICCRSSISSGAARWARS